MIACKIRQTGAFMNKLLTTELFDSFVLEKATIRGAGTFTLEGRLNREFYTEEEWNSQERTSDYMPWQEARPLLYQMIRGKKPPVSFLFTLQLHPKYVEGVLKSGDATIAANLVNSLVINCRYEENSLTLITGVSLTTFVPDKSADTAWDKTMRAFLTKREIDYEEI